MEHLSEFIVNHLMLWGALVVVLVLVVKAEYEHQTNRSNQLNPMGAIRLMNNDDRALVIDVREPPEYKNGHIKTARNMPLSSFKDKLGELDKYKDEPVLTYCNSGASSLKACKMLQKAGFRNVHNISGGISGWLDAKLPLTKK